jgi:hypothetical protein
MFLGGHGYRLSDRWAFLVMPDRFEVLYFREKNDRSFIWEIMAEITKEDIPCCPSIPRRGMGDMILGEVNTTDFFRDYRHARLRPGGPKRAVSSPDD